MRKIILPCNLGEPSLQQMGQSESRCLNYTIQNTHYLVAVSLIQMLSPKSIFLFSLISRAVGKQLSITPPTHRHRHIATRRTIYVADWLSPFFVVLADSGKSFFFISFVQGQAPLSQAFGV